VDGVFTSPPYVGQIDYHEQHVYAYELFGIPRRDVQEIGPKREGKSRKACERYVDGIAEVIRNIRRFVRPGRPMFFVANDRLNLYPEIARRSGCRIVHAEHRAVSKRTERDKRPYSETIFQME
jgi:DNA modification methylase